MSLNAEAYRAIANALGTFTARDEGWAQTA
jgi:hypothetical protein